MKTKIEACEHEITETFLTLTNWKHLYTGATQTVIANLADKLVKGKFDKEKAAKAFLNVVEIGLKDKQWNIVYGDWKPNTASRSVVAKDMLDKYKDEICEKAESLAGPEYVIVWVENFSHDINGNAVAQHLVFDDKGTLLSSQKPRREQIGFTDHLDACKPAMTKAGILSAWYELEWVEGSRSEGKIAATYKRMPIDF